MLLNQDDLKGRPHRGERLTEQQVRDLARVSEMLTINATAVQHLMGYRGFDELQRRFLEDALVAMPELVRVYLEGMKNARG